MLATDVIERAEKRIGQTLCGKWHLDRVIGVGGMAAVYEATHRNRNRVAIKMLHPELSLEEGTRSRFLREGYVANTIRHPGAVQILDDDVTTDNVAFLVMELLHGESLEERVMRKGGTLEPSEALLLVEQLLDVLAAAHDQGVVHRDIKPDNLFLTRDGRLKVLDFGIARLHQGDSRATKVGSFMGTPAFCAPEQARGRWDEVDARTDLFSVGATLFTLLSGVHVHEAETSSEQLALAISATARPLSAVCLNAPTELVELVGTALAYDKEDRFQSARAMQAAVQRVLAGLPALGKLSSPPIYASPESPSRAWTAAAAPVFGKHRVLWAVALSGVLAALLVLFVRATHPAAEAPPPVSGGAAARGAAAEAGKLGQSSPAPVASAGQTAESAVASAASPSSPAAGVERATLGAPGARPSASFPTPEGAASPPSGEAPGSGSSTAQPSPPPAAPKPREPAPDSDKLFDNRF